MPEFDGDGADGPGATQSRAGVDRYRAPRLSGVDVEHAAVDSRGPAVGVRPHQVENPRARLRQPARSRDRPAAGPASPALIDGHGRRSVELDRQADAVEDRARRGIVQRPRQRDRIATRSCSRPSSMQRTAKRTRSHRRDHSCSTGSWRPPETRGRSPPPGRHPSSRSFIHEPSTAPLHVLVVGVTRSSSTSSASCLFRPRSPRRRRSRAGRNPRHKPRCLSNGAIARTSMDRAEVGSGTRRSARNVPPSPPLPRATRLRWFTAREPRSSASKTVPDLILSSKHAWSS